MFKNMAVYMDFMPGFFTRDTLWDRRRRIKSGVTVDQRQNTP